MPTPHDVEGTLEQIDSAGGASKPRLARIGIVLALLLSLATVTAACGGGSGNSDATSNSAKTLITQGLRAQSSGNMQQAIRDFAAAASKEPTSPLPYYNIGVIYQEYLKKPSEAATYYEKALHADAKYKSALFNLAVLNTSTNPQTAINFYNRLLAINPNDPNVLFNLGLLLIGGGHTTQGEADVQKAVALNPALRKRVPAGVTP